MLAPGWYKGVMGLTKARNNYGDQTAFTMEIMVRYTDGTTESICTQITPGQAAIHLSFLLRFTTGNL